MPSNNPPAGGLASVYAEDTTLFDLCTAELFVVTVLRLWMSGGDDPDHPAYWRRAFGVAGIAPGGAPAFGSLMRAVAGAALQPLDVRQRTCRGLGRDEGLLLRLISLLQSDCVDEASKLLAAWLPPAAARLVSRPAECLATALAGAGLMVPLRHAEAARVHRSAACAHATPGLALVQ
jgi:hypothetical protein